MANQHEPLASFSIHPDVLLSALEDATALVDRRRRIRTMNPRMTLLFASDDTAGMIPFIEEDGRHKLVSASRVEEPLRSAVVGIEDVIAGALERHEADLGSHGASLLAIACSIDGFRGALIRIRLRSAEEEHRARCVEIVEAMQLGLYVYRLEDAQNAGSLRSIYCNPAAEKITNRPRNQFVGRLLDEISSAARERGLLQKYYDVVTDQAAQDIDYSVEHGSKENVVHYSIRAFPLSGRCIGSIFEDATARKTAEEALRREVELLEKQTALLDLVRQLSTPLLPLAEGILVAPIVGQMDDERGALFVEQLLQGIQRYAARIVLIDVTGVPSIDASVAEQILRAARAAKLLGTRTALVGISPEVARTMVEMGFDATGLVTYANLRAGMRAAEQWQRADAGENRRR